jgi:hypothetical protein
MKQITINIPDEIAAKLPLLPKDINTYIENILKHKINEIEQDNILINEYQMAAKENVTLLKDFAVVDYEMWEDDY